MAVCSVVCFRLFVFPLIFWSVACLFVCFAILSIDLLAVFLFDRVWNDFPNCLCIRLIGGLVV